ncbi:uncharacterized protein LOC132712888 [Ruditapes philippinarum]|uniref:uncharacterized protein LOC132712888 n=1 Tax=Ruditapes philippinarum TaxID=129788 RepID=UPI00295AB2A4|nr:uncharacterized protein LOC132712888 [Ruditapes philippinarum]
MYDLCIIGAGMIGSAAARHATVTSGLNTCLIGPTEQKDRGSDKTSGIDGSYFDEGRITRCMDKDVVWATLARESIQRYRDLEQQSGIKFYHEVGNLMIGGRSYLNKTDEVASRNAIPTRSLVVVVTTVVVRLFDKEEEEVGWRNGSDGIAFVSYVGLVIGYLRSNPSGKPG